MDLNKKEKLAINETANALIKVWKPARIPLITKANVVKKIRLLVKSYRKFKYYKKETSSLVTFREPLNQRNMIAAEDAENRIMKDTDLLPKNEEVELKFLAMLEDNKTASLGKVGSGSQFVLKLAPLRQGKIILAPLQQSTSLMSCFCTDSGVARNLKRGGGIISTFFRHFFFRQYKFEAD